MLTQPLQATVVKGIEFTTLPTPESLPSSYRTAIEEQSSTAFNPGWSFYLAIISICTVIIVVALDATSLSIALPIISQDLGGTGIEASWSGTSFLVASTVFQPNFASMSHIFGRKPLVC
jgi:hypothetical protein